MPSIFLAPLPAPSRVGAERDALLEQLAGATGVNGRIRTTGSSDERARVAVKKAISAALNRLGAIDEPLAGHLKARIHTGTSCSYEPAPEDQLTWVLD
jgi:hypothetical protein